MKALLLAAGLGTRLKPLTDYIPKCLVPIHGRPLIDYWLHNLLNNEIEEVIVNTHYLAPMVCQYLSNSKWNSKVKLVHEEILLGTGGTYVKNRGFFEGEACLVAHADNLTIFDPLTFSQAHSVRPPWTEMSMMVFETPDPQSCGIVSIDTHGVVRSFHEKVINPPGTIANAAVYIFEPSVLKWMIDLGKTPLDISTDVIPNFIGKIFTYRNNSYHRDIGTIESWKQANLDFPSSLIMRDNVRNR